MSAQDASAKLLPHGIEQCNEDLRHYAGLVVLRTKDPTTIAA